MDAELLALQQAFSTLQEQESAARLSEANCVELIGKLVKSKRLQLLYTLDGSEYVTEAQLGLEIQDEVQAHGGRIEVVKLQALLNVDLEHVERKVRELVAQDDSLRIVAQGELVTQYYLDQLCLEIEEALQTAGEMPVSDLASRFAFSNDLIIALVRDAIAQHVVHGVLEDGVLYTQSFVRRERARLRGALAAVTVPTPVQKMQVALDIHKKLFYQFLDELVGRDALGELSGKRHNNETFVPLLYSRTTERSISTFFKANNYVPYERVTATLNVDHPQQWLKRQFPTGVALVSCFADASLLDGLDGCIDEALAEEGFADAQPLVPASLTEEDVALMLGMCKCLLGEPWKGKAIVLSDRYVFSDKFVDAARKRCDGLVLEALEQYTKRLTSVVGAPPPAAAAAPAAAEPADGDADDDDNKDKQRRGGKKRGGGGRAAAAPAAAASGKKGAAAAAASGGGASGASSPAALLPLERCQRALRDSQKDCEPDMVRALAVHLHPQLLERLAEECKSVSVSVKASPLELSKEELNQLISDFAVHSQNFDLFEAAITKLALPALDAVMAKHLVKTTGALLASICLRLEASANKLAVGNLNDEKDRADLVKRFPEQSAVTFQHLLKSLGGSAGVAAFRKALKGCSDLCQLRVKPLDKKAEKQLLLTHRQGFLQQLAADAEDAAVTLHLATVCAFAMQAELVLNVPSRVFPELLVAHRALLVPALADRLVQCWELLAAGDTQAVRDALPDLREKLADKGKKPAAAGKRTDPKLNSNNE